MRRYNQKQTETPINPPNGLNRPLGFDYSDFSRHEQLPKVGKLDPIGTSQKGLYSNLFALPIPAAHRPLLDEINAMKDARKGNACYKNAPIICIPGNAGKQHRIFQGTCNDWNCPRCGLIRANTEFARISKGVHDLAADGNEFFMLTWTCRGTVTSRQAEIDYAGATNNLKTALRYQVKKSGQFWAYAEVTERQKRQHPHSHLIATFKPHDAYHIGTIKGYRRYVKDVATLNRQLPIEMRFSPKKFTDKLRGEYFSMWLSLECVKLGLGVQCSVSKVRSVRAVVNYLAKYLFKSALDTRWPKGWRRIRYSQSWPKFEETESEGAFAVLSAADWKKVWDLNGKVYTDEPIVYQRAMLHGCDNVFCTVDNHIDEEKPPPRWHRTDDEKYGKI